MTGNTNVGGIVGENRADGIVLICYNKGTIVGTNEVGGICGMNRGILQNCENEGKINDEDLKTTLDLKRHRYRNAESDAERRDKK
mgnify:CR=1 FL=1